ncbi:MAG TPA: sugar ABC transporter permease [Aliiroseovarius sp.]|nr:sugar ABC transporter permease [Aliiroseovarius sp.]
MTDPENHRPEPALRPTRRSLRFATLRTILAMILREMSTTYGRTPGGYAWVVLEPVLGIALLSALFSLGFRSPPLGINFPVFYATGLLPFFMFNDISAKMAQSVNFSRALLSYPRVTYIDALIARLILSVLTQLLVSFIVLASIRLIWETRTFFQAGPVLLGYLMVIALGIGVGTMNCFLVTMFPIWQRIWSIITRPLLFISGVIILYESIPEAYSAFFWLNPLLHAISKVRSGFYPSYDAPWVSPAYVFAVSLILTVLGLVFLHRYHRDMLER